MRLATTQSPTSNVASYADITAEKPFISITVLHPQQKGKNPN